MSDLDKYSYHEAVDRVSLALNFIDDNIMQHPVVSHHKKLRKKANKIIMLLGELYQEAARTADEEYPEKI